MLQKRLAWQNTLLLVASYVFYGWWDWRFLTLIFFSSLVDYIVSQYLGRTEDDRKRKWLLYTSLAVNLGVLGFFKYFNFFIDSFVETYSLFGHKLEPRSLNIILPVGISFYTFQTLSYTIDVYRRTLKPTRNIIEFFTFVSFFPQLVAGPIERAAHLLPQFKNQRVFDYTFAVSGLRLMLWGFFKKIVIADRLAAFVDVVYSNPEQHYGLTVILGTLFFAIQIYCDFSAYSDIAVGTARLFGFDLMRNFRTPYFSTSMKEFWSRWHISLSTWFRDYLYIPLGGNRVMPILWARNMMITFVVSGLWHGASFTFIIWGFIHGLVLIMEVQLAKYADGRFALNRAASWFITFSLVCLAWVFFRAENVSEAFMLLSHMTQGLPEQLLNPVQVFQQTFSSGLNPYVFIASLAVFLLVDGLIGTKDINDVFTLAPKPVRYVAYYTIVAWIVMWGAYDLTPQFIYFQF
ncbi:D-alanyl-lipoteichoic acid acyltransferase DltB (MBOAT superfamily) [Pontibacter aydingkolensis]|nr:MBOAT family O-acyltransferase [Pontibacter aydingkolensis]